MQLFAVSGAAASQKLCGPASLPVPSESGTAAQVRRMPADSFWYRAFILMEEAVMGTTLVAIDSDQVLDVVGATDALVYRRAAGGRFVLTGPPVPGVTGELLVDDEPLVRDALALRVCRVAAEVPRLVCGGYTARAAAVVSVDRDVIVVLGRRDGCLKGVADVTLLGAAAAIAASQSRGV